MTARKTVCERRELGERRLALFYRAHLMAVEAIEEHALSGQSSQVGRQEFVVTLGVTGGERTGGRGVSRCAWFVRRVLCHGPRLGKCGHPQRSLLLGAVWRKIGPAPVIDLDMCGVGVF